ncbi:unnamed protein product [Lepidochelys olivacea]
MTRDHYFKVHLNGQISRPRTLNSGIPQGSVLALILFNLYTMVIPATESRKLMYADDIALAVQHISLHTISCTLTQDLNTIADYFQRWKLRPNLKKKKQVTTFHLNNKMANTKLDVQFCGESISHEANPKYLGVTLDWSLTCQQNLKNTCNNCLGIFCSSILCANVVSQQSH